MTEQEFREEMEEFWKWVSKRERPVRHWFASLEEFATQRWNEEYNKDKDEGRLK